MNTRIEIIKNSVEKIEDVKQLKEAIVLFRSLLYASERAISDLEDLNRIYPDAYARELNAEINRSNHHETVLDILGDRLIELTNQ